MQGRIKYSKHINGSLLELDEIKKTPVSERPKRLGPSYKKEYFTQNISFLSFWLPLFIILLNSGFIAHKSGGAVSDYMAGLLLTIITGTSVMLGHLSICSEYTSSNLGTYFRKTEPIRYWSDVAILYSVAIFFNACFFFLKS